MFTAIREQLVYPFKALTFYYAVMKSNQHNMYNYIFIFKIKTGVSLFIANVISMDIEVIT